MVSSHGPSLGKPSDTTKPAEGRWTLDEKPEGLVRQFHRGLLVQPNCEGCPLQGEKIVPPEGDPTATVAIVGEAPGYYDSLQDRVFASSAGKFLDILLHRAGAERAEFWLTNTVLCRPKPVPDTDGSILNPDQVARRAAAFCRPRLLGELAIVKPKAIVGFGSETVRSVYDSSASLKGRRGGIHQISLAAQLAQGNGVKP